jgi:hypothetical protein
MSCAKRPTATRRRRQSHDRLPTLTLARSRDTLPGLGGIAAYAARWRRYIGLPRPDGRP